MSRRGFTLIETLMAATLGALVVMVCVGLFTSMDRTDRSTSLRFDQTSALSRVHLVMRRAFGNIVMSETPVGSGPLGNAGAAPAPEGEPENEPEVRPRILLEPDPNAKTGGGGARPQRLEIVLNKAPVPPMLNTVRGEAIAMANYEPTVYTGPALRGVFELRPDPEFAKAKNWGVPGLDPQKTGWTLWWRPLPHKDEGPESILFDIHPEEDPGAVPIASGLEKFRWVAFNKRERGDAFSATQFQELPAYMELEVRTTTGLTAHWMFEVDWINGPETEEELEAQQQNQLAGAGAGAPAGGGPAGGAGGNAGRGSGGADAEGRDAGRMPNFAGDDDAQAVPSSERRRRVEDIRRRRGSDR